MKPYRLQKTVQVIHFWDFISSAIKRIAEKSGERFDEDVVRKTLINAVDDEEHSWLGLVLDDTETPIAFAFCQECTPDFETRRFFVARWFYHTPGRFDATMMLMMFFEGWAKHTGVNYYSITSRRSNEGAVRCFASSKYGFKKAFLTFEKFIQ